MVITAAMHVKPVYHNIVCFGDSLTQQASGPGGFVASLQDVYQRRLEVVSRGFSGYTSRQGLALCPKLFQPDDKSDVSGPSVKLATLWFGTNDCIRPGLPQHVPLDEFRANMAAILRDAFSGVHVVVLTPTTVVPGLFEGHEDDTLHVQYGNALRDVVEQVSAERKHNGQPQRIVLLDTRALFLTAVANGDRLVDLFQVDGLHISPLGYRVLFDGLMAVLQTHLPEWMPEKLKFVVPEWRALKLNADPSVQSAQLELKRQSIA